MKPFKLAARESHEGDTLIEINSSRGTVKIGEGYCTVIAGPCAVEGREEYLDIARILADMGVHLLRGGAFKPRTSPYSFAGLGEEGLKILAEAKKLREYRWSPRYSIPGMSSLYRAMWTFFR